MEPMQDFCLDNLAGGGAVEQFNEAISKVLANIRDPNTDPRETRKIVLRVAFKAAENRESAAIAVDVSVALASPRRLGSQIFIGERNGRPVAVTHDPRQSDIFAQAVDGDGVVSIKRKETVSA